TAGLRGALANVTYSIAPTFVYEQNQLFTVLPGSGLGRSSFSSPFYSGPVSADLPLRFGASSSTRITPGESWLEASFGSVAVGASSVEQWWGPGIRNALVMSNNAAGVPEAYVRSARPIATPIGD